MTTMQKLLTTAAVLVAVAVPAHAELVNGWKVEYYPKIFGGACIGETSYPKHGTTLNFAKFYRDNATLWGLMLENKGWKATKGENSFQVVIKTGPEGNPKNRKTLVKTMVGLDDGGLLVNDLTADEMNTFAFDGDASAWFFTKKDGKLFAALKIDRSAMVIRAVQACLKARAPNDQVANNPSTPPTAPKEEGHSFGTGFFVAPKHVLTSAHVVKGCNAIYVKYPTYKAVRSYVVSIDAKNDLAVLKTDLPPDGIATFRLRGKLGELVASYGFPYGNVLSTSGNFTTGGLTALRGFEDDSSMIQVSAPLQPGNSGGPLLDSSGSVLGVTDSVMGTLNAAVAAGGAVPQNVNFGVSAGTAVTFLGSNNIDAQVTSGGNKLEPEAIAEMAMKFTVQISCESHSPIKDHEPNVPRPAPQPLPPRHDLCRDKILRNQC